MVMAMLMVARTIVLVAVVIVVVMMMMVAVAMLVVMTMRLKLSMLIMVQVVMVVVMGLMLRMMRVLMTVPGATQPHALDDEQEQQSGQGRHPRTGPVRHRSMVVPFVDLPAREVRQQMQEDGAEEDPRRQRDEQVQPTFGPPPLQGQERPHDASRQEQQGHVCGGEAVH